MPGENETFENIYYDLSKQPGKCRLTSYGLGWKPLASKKDKDQANGTEVITLQNTEIVQAQWSRAAKGYEMRIFTKTKGVVQLDGFEQDDLDRLRDAVKGYFGIKLDVVEHSLKGWNWGKTEFTKHELHFNVGNRAAFEIPYSEVTNLNLTGKAEVAVEFVSGNDGSRTSGRRKKATAGVDQLVEMRFYVPGQNKKKVGDGGSVDGDGIKEDGEGDEDKKVDTDGEAGEDVAAANIFYDTLKEKAEIGEVAGVTIATFLDILFLTPRGRYDIDMYESSFRLRGKTYDYKIPYEHVKKFFLLPKPDDVHMMAVIGLDPPLRQGQTRYPFLVMQFKKEEDMDFDLNISEDVLKQKYEGKLQMHYESAAHQVVSSIFKGLTGRKITAPSRDFISHHQQSGVKCSLKANEGHLFFLDKAFLFVPKPAMLLQFDNVQHVTLSRVSGPVSASRTFDVTIVMTKGLGEHQFNNINREEIQPLQDFLKAKNLKVKNDLVDEVSNALLASALDDEMDEDDEEVGVRADRGSADEDEESVDEDFEAESESEVAEEYDSQHESSGPGSGDEDAEGEDDDIEDDDMDVDDESEADGRNKKKKSSAAPPGNVKPSSKAGGKGGLAAQKGEEGPAKKKVKTKK